MEVDLGRQSMAGYLVGGNGRFSVQRSRNKAVVVEVTGSVDEEDQTPWELNIVVSASLP